MGLDLGRWISDRKKDIVDIFDANTQRDQQKRLAAGQPRYYQDQQRQQQQSSVPQRNPYQLNNPNPQSSRITELQNEVDSRPLFQNLLDKTKVFDANTPGDRLSRLLKGEQELYRDQKLAEGDSRPTQNVGDAIFGGTARGLNTAAAQLTQAEATKRMIAAQLTGNAEAYRNANQLAKAADEQFGETGGLFNSGTWFTPEEVKKGELTTGLRRVGGGTVEAGAEVAGLGLGGVTGKTLLKQGIKQGLKSQAGNIAANAATNVAQGGAYAFNKDESLKDVATQAALAGVTGTAADIGLGLAGAGGAKVSRRVVEDIAGMNEIGAVGKNVRGELGDAADNTLSKEAKSVADEIPVGKAGATAKDIEKATLKVLDDTTPLPRPRASLDKPSAPVRGATPDVGEGRPRVSLREPNVRSNIVEATTGKKNQFSNESLIKGTPEQLDTPAILGGPTQKAGVEKTIAKIMREEGLNRTQATKRMEQILKESTAKGQTLADGAIGGEPSLRPVGKRPLKDEAFQEVLQSISKGKNKASVEATLASSAIEQKAKSLGVDTGQDFIDRYQAGLLETDAEKELGQAIKQITDAMFEKQKRLTPEVEYRQNYLPNVYSEPADVVQEATSRLGTKTNAGNQRVFENYAEARQFGLNPKYNSVEELIANSAKRTEGAIQNKQAVTTGLEKGLFNTNPRSGTPVAGMVDAAGNQIYAQKEVADILNGVLQEDTTAIGKTMNVAGNLAGKAQDVMLQGGIPATNANFFVAGQSIKDTTRNLGKAPLHPIQAFKQEGNVIKDFFTGLKGTQKRFTEGTFKANGATVKNIDFVRELADEGLYIQPQSKATKMGKNKVEKGWDALGNNPTFGRYMPNRILSTAQEVYSQSVEKLGHKEAVKFAAETTKKYTGQVDEIMKGRSQLAQDVMKTGLFAPKYRESIIGSLRNIVKSVYPNNWADPTFAPSRQLLAGMVMTLAGYEALNRKITGHSMVDNREGQELSLEIPIGEKDEKGTQRTVNIPFMPGYMTIPRAVVGAATSAIRGDVKGVGSNASKALSAPLQTAGNVLSNKDYFGRPIYNDEETAAKEGVNPDSGLAALGKVSKYVGGQFSPAWVRGVADFASGKPTEEALAVALEAPVRFGKKLDPSTKAYFDDREEIYNSLDKNARAAYDTIHPKLKNVNGEYMTDKTVDSGLARASVYLDNPKVLEADNEMARRAAERGEKVDPLFQLSPTQQRIALRMDTLPPKDPNKTVLKQQNEWYQPYVDKRSAFFESLPPGDPNKPKGPITYPEPTGEVAALQEAYYQLEDSSMKRKMMDNNPELVEQFAREEQYSRAVRAAKNLPQYDKYPETPKDVQNIIDFYMALPKGEGPNGKSPTRSNWIKSHPNEWAKMGEAFDKIALYNLQRDMSLASFEGVDPTEKGIKAIASLAEDSSGSGYGKSYGYGGGGGRSYGSGSGSSSSSSRLPTGSVYKYAIDRNAGGTPKKAKVSIKARPKTGATKPVKVAKPKVSLKKVKA